MLTSLIQTVLLLAVVLPVTFAETGVEMRRRLGGRDLPYDPAADICKIGEDENGEDIYGTCDPSIHFPNCDEDKTFICFNRVNRRDKFHPDKVPYYYIDPRRIHCYPNDYLKDGGCSTCSPGRYCLAERRCILEEIDYPCGDWL